MDTWMSATACPKCGSPVKVTEINEDHGDIRYHCTNKSCDYAGIEEGPDY